MERAWAALHASASEGVRQLRSLHAAPRELWLCFVNKFLTAYGYFALSIVLVLHLQDLGYSGALHFLFSSSLSLLGPRPRPPPEARVFAARRGALLRD